MKLLSKRDLVALFLFLIVASPLLVILIGLLHIPNKKRVGPLYNTKITYQSKANEWIHVESLVLFDQANVRCGSLPPGIEKVFYLGEKYIFHEEIPIVWHKVNEDGTDQAEKFTKIVSIKDIPKEERTNNIIFEYHGGDNWTVHFGEPLK